MRGQPLQILPVIDVLGGRAVHAIAGRRDRYRPVESRLGPTGDVLGLFSGFHELLRTHEIYVADLDAIRHERPNRALIRDLAEAGAVVLLDRGVRSPLQVREAIADGAENVVVALETLPTLTVLTDILDDVGPERVTFSLDLRGGHPMTINDAWRNATPDSIAATVLAAGVGRLIVLDLADVGMGNGVGTFDVCRRLRELAPEARIITGGGVRAIDDLVALAEAGIDGALVASALHDGRIDANDLAAFRERYPAESPSSRRSKTSG